MIREDIYVQIFEEVKEKLKRKYQQDPNASSQKFEGSVVKIIENVIETWESTQPEESKLDFEIRHLGKHHYPDIVIENKTDHEKIGLEVKYHIQNNLWKTTGNSTYESISEDGLDKIYLLFGHFKKVPPEFKIAPIDRCLSDVVITHSPRYSIDMEYGQDFCAQRLGVPYERLRQLEKKQRETYINTYVAQTKYKELSSVADKELLIAQSFILFPEIFSTNKKIRYRRMSVWLFAKGILCRNTRDFLSASGTQKIDLIGQEELPRVFSRLYERRTDIRREIVYLPSIVLEHSWNDETIRKGPPVSVSKNSEDRLNMWIDILSKQYGGAHKRIENTSYPFKATIEKLLL